MTEHQNNLQQPIGKPLAKWSLPDFPVSAEWVGRTCRLVPLDAEVHGPSLYQAFSQDSEGKNWTYLPYGPFANYDEFKGWLCEACESRDPQFYAIVQLATGEAVGMASYLRINPTAGSIEVGHIHFSESLKRSVVATEAMYRMMKVAFELGYRRYEWKCDSLNSASCSSAQRLGFSFEGLFRNALVYKGRNRDTAWFSVIEEEWPLLEKAFLRWLDADNFSENGEQIQSLRFLTQPILKRVPDIGNL